MEQSSESKPKLNIFALPNQTTIIFLIIATVVLGTVLVGSFGSPYSIKSLALVLLILPPRAFLARPGYRCKRDQLSFSDDTFKKLQEKIEECTKQVELPHSPKLLISPKKIHLHTFGTFRHWYIAISKQKAQEWQKELEAPETVQTAEVKIFHELYHFKTGDYWQLGYASELIRMTGFIMLWAFGFFIGLGSFLIKVKPVISQLNQYAVTMVQATKMLTGFFPDLTSFVEKVTPLINEVNQRMATVDFSWVMISSVGSTYPFAIIGLVLWGIYRPKLWRTREFYADAGVVREQHDTLPYFSARTRIPLSYFRKKSSSESKPSSSIPQQKKTFRSWLKVLWKSVKILPKKHPDDTIQIRAIEEPEQVFDNWFDTAILVGTLAFVLEILTMTPMTLHHAGRWPLHFPTLAILVIVSLNYLIPQIVQGKSVRNDILKIIGVITVLRLLTICVLLLIFISFATFAPNMFLEGMAAISFDNAEFQDPEAFMSKAAVINLGQVIIVSLVLVVAFMAITALQRRLFTWYGFPEAERHLMKVAYGVIGVICLFLLLTVLPFISTLMVEPHNLLKSSYLVLGFSGLLALGIGLKFFTQADQRYARRCPHCGKTIPGFYELGKRCDGGCHELLHPWLLIESNHRRISTGNVSGFTWCGSKVYQYVEKLRNFWNLIKNNGLQGIQTVREFWNQHPKYRELLKSAGFWIAHIGKIFFTKYFPLISWGVLIIDAILICIAHKIHFSHPFQNPRPILYYAGWIFGSLAVISTYYIIRYRVIFRTWKGWIAVILLMFFSNLIFQNIPSASSIPPPFPFFLLVLAVVSFWTVVPGTAILLWYKDLGLRFFACGLVIVVWIVTLAWRFQGNLFQVFLSFVQQRSVPWWTSIFSSITYLIIPIGLISFVGHTIWLLIWEIFLPERKA